MENKKLFIPILLGTVRKARESAKVAKFIVSQVRKHPEIETQLFDVKDMNLPMDDEGETLKDKNPEYRDAIIRADGLIIVTPEYNHGYPGSLKRALDILLREYVHKAVAICAVSSGNFGGARVIEHLTAVVRELGLVATFADLHFPKVGELFDESGKIKDESTYLPRIDTFLTELIWMTKTLRWGREHIPSKYHSSEK